MPWREFDGRAARRVRMRVAAVRHTPAVLPASGKHVPADRQFLLVSSRGAVTAEERAVTRADAAGNIIGP
jgi:hypothetical protein